MDIEVLSVRIPTKVKKVLAKDAFEHNTTMQEIVLLALTEHYEKQGIRFQDSPPKS